MTKSGPLSASPNFMASLISNFYIGCSFRRSCFCIDPSLYSRTSDVDLVITYRRRVAFVSCTAHAFNVAAIGLVRNASPV